MWSGGGGAAIAQGTKDKAITALKIENMKFSIPVWQLLAVGRYCVLLGKD